MKATLDDASFGHQDECSSLFIKATLGDADAADRLYARCVPPLRAWLASRVDHGMAEDIAHEALVVAFRKNAHFHSGSAFMPWLRAIARRLAQKALRHDARRQSWEIEFFETERLHADAATEPDARRRAALEECLAALPDRQSQLIRSRYYEGRSSETIAATQGRSRVAVAVNLHRICKRLRAEIERIMQSPAHGSAANG